MPTSEHGALFADASERRGDVVYTPAWVAADIVAHFAPSGRVLDPCKGEGVFLDYLPARTEWCEITEGRDFFDWQELVDWVVSNPPYSLTRKWFRHSYTVSDNLLYLVPLRNVFSGYGFLREINEYGGIAAIRVYGTGGKLGFPMGNAVGAMHIARGHIGPTAFSYYEDDAAEVIRAEPDGRTPSTRVVRYAVKGRHGWCAVKRGHVPQEGEMNTPTACDMWIPAPWGFERGLKNVSCEDCRGR